MPKIFDNIENHLTKGLNQTLELSHRADFCVGYFNLRGWKEVTEKIDQLSGAEVWERDKNIFRICRLLVGMHKRPDEILREFYSKGEDYILDQAEAFKLKKNLPRNSEINFPI
jgi:hypothetical protein